MTIQRLFPASSSCWLAVCVGTASQTTGADSGTRWPAGKGGFHSALVIRYIMREVPAAPPSLPETPYQTTQALSFPTATVLSSFLTAEGGRSLLL